ncbi:MAG: lysophospholipid acyltransferase family protein [Pirellulaceae bacterium]
MPETIAFGFLMLLLAISLIAAVVGMARSPYTPAQTTLFVMASLLVRVLWRSKLPGPLPVARGRGVVVVCNHRSSVDPFFVQVCCDRPVHWMVAREYYEHFAFRWFLKTCEAIPVRRTGVDTASTKAAIRFASQGELVGMLAEGRINRGDEFMLPVRPGAVLVALKARVPILPCYIHGAPYGGTVWSPLWMPARVSLRFGELMDLSPYYDRTDEPGIVGELMSQVVAEIARLAGHDDFVPRLAGRRWRTGEGETEG